MQIFINECSLNEQYKIYDFVDSLKLFIKTINLLKQYNSKTIYRSHLFFDYKALKGMHLDKTLKANNDINNWFNQNIKNAIKWQEEKVHDPNSSYKYLQIDYVGTSLAEVTERQINDPGTKAVLINFIDSIFLNNTTIGIVKNDAINSNLNCVYNETSLHEWLVNAGYIDPRAIYDEKLGLPPLDRQTVVLTSGKFESTKWRNGYYGRIVYRLKGTNQLWVVDGSIMHAKDKAHIEIFDENTKKHLGTSIYNIIDLNSDYKKPERTINLV